ncbi:MAG: BatD family protein, partial [Planctomycetes bacterium]|nr:BatD family protein [Planctomycetota bacterium]
LTLTDDSQQGDEVEKPPFGEAIGGFQIRDYREPLVEVRGDRQILRQIYTLEPTRSGKQSIAPITVAFVDRRPQGDGERHTVQTESLQLEVTSVLPEEVSSLDDLQPLAGPVELPESGVPGWPWWVGASSAIVIAAAGIWLATRHRRGAEARILSPQELAFLELDQLIEMRLAESSIKEFYVQLTGIVRRYIERTTGIRAPEQTTEEFLREIGSGHVFPEEERRRLEDFLQSADLVKFAAMEPTSADVERTFERAKAFIGLDVQEVAA